MFNDPRYVPELYDPAITTKATQLEMDAWMNFHVACMLECGDDPDYETIECILEDACRLERESLKERGF